MSVPMPAMAATIERRLLINYRLDPTVAQRLLPASLRPQLVDGSAVAGICLLRLGAFRPTWVRPQLGWGAENAAHRIAVEWDDANGTHSGVYVPQRHSASWLPVIAGSRVFPGVHHHARFDVTEGDGRFKVEMQAPGVEVAVDVAISSTWSSTLFPTVEDASAFFRKGSVGWSPDRAGNLEGLGLETDSWKVEAGSALRVESSFFNALPAGAAEFDCALLMRNVPIVWSLPSGATPSSSKLEPAR
jgi:hypothetical protein